MSLSDIPDSLDEILTHQDFRMGLNILRDAREAVQPDVYGYHFFLQESPKRLNRFESAFGDCKLAWVINDAQEFAKVHQFTLARRLSDDTIERKPFKTIEAAKDWLNIPEDYQITFAD